MKRDAQRERPPPLKIKKPQENGDRNAGNGMTFPPHQPQQYRQPVIIQTFSPEVIQTDPHNFMALVQKLTGRDILRSPLHKKPCLALKGAATDPNSYNLILQQNQRNVLGISGFNPTTRPPLLPSSQPPRGSDDLSLRLGIGVPPSAPAWQTTVNSILSPSKFDFSPSGLPSPSSFLKDFTFVHSTPSLTSSSSSEESSSLSSPKLAMGAADGLRASLAGFPSPGPLTRLLAADLPFLSPATYKLLEDYTLSADPALPRSHGLPPRPPHG